MTDWQAPRLVWNITDGVTDADFNRIEGNIQHLQEVKETPAGAQLKVDLHDDVTNPHGATVTAIADRLVLRDAAGRAQIAAPVAPNDIARLQDIQNVKGNVETDVTEIIGVQFEIHERSTYVFEDANERINRVEERSGTEVVKLSTLTHDIFGNVTGVTEVVGNETITTTLHYHPDGKYSHSTRLRTVTP